MPERFVSCPSTLPRALLLASAAALASVSLAGRADAQLAGRKEAAPAAPEPPKAALVITPPVVHHDEGAIYPQEALAAGVRQPVTVVLVLEIDPSGAVRSATVENPTGSPFEQAAVDAAGRITFQPARRDGQPVAARIKHKYDFTPPAGRFSGRIVSQATGTPLEGATVRVKDATGERATVATASDGTFRTDALPAGPYQVTIEAAGHTGETVDHELAPGEEASVALRLAGVPVVALPPAAGDVPVQEVRVVSKRPPREITRRTLEQRELTRIPGTNGDALRAVQNLPGVGRAPGLAGLLIVRGSAPNATNVFVDGTLVPIVYHFGGLSSVIPTEVIDRIDFYPGNFSAVYGRVTGGVVDVATRDPARDSRLHGLAQVDLIDARVLAEGPFFDTGWKFLVAGRRSWVDTWLKPVLKATGAGVTAAPVYYDYQAMLARDFSKDANFRVFFFGSDDRLGLLVRQASASGIGGSFGLHTGFWRVQARYRQRFSPETELKFVGAVGQDVIDLGISDNRLTVDSRPITTRLELTQKVVRGFTANVGMDILYAPYDVFVRLPPPARPGEPASGPFGAQPPLELKESGATYRPAMYVEAEITPTRGTRIVPGLRADYSRDTQSWDVAPRVTARQDLHAAFPRTTVKGGAGIFFQPPQPQDTTAVFGVPGITSSRAHHYGLGVEQELTRNVEVSFEGFYKKLDAFFTPRIGNVATGQAYGLETLIRYKPDERFFGWVAYTLARSALRDTPEEPQRLASFDQTHILTVLGSYRLGHGWEIGARFRVVTGNPNTPSAYGFYDQNGGAYLPLQTYPPLSSRLPTFNQFDIRVDKRWDFQTWKLAVYLDVQNVYNAGNPEQSSYNYNFTRRTYANGIPFLPSLGLRAEL